MLSREELRRPLPSELSGVACNLLPVRLISLILFLVKKVPGAQDACCRWPESRSTDTRGSLFQYQAWYGISIGRRSWRRACMAMGRG